MFQLADATELLGAGFWGKLLVCWKKATIVPKNIQYKLLMSRLAENYTQKWAIITHTYQALNAILELAAQ